MRTTVTLDPDVERILKEAMHRSRSSFKKTLNNALRAGLSGRTLVPEPRPFRVRARAMGLRPGFDPAGFNRLADDLQIDAFLLRRQRAAKR